MPPLTFPSSLSCLTFPQPYPPPHIILLKLFSTLSKFFLPLILQFIYTSLKEFSILSELKDNYCVEGNTNELMIRIGFIIVGSVGIGHVFEILTEVQILKYKLRIKKELMIRIVDNSIDTYVNDQTNLDQKSSLKLCLWSKLTQKLPIYIYNYQISLLCLIFQSLNIILVSIYLYSYLSFSILLGLILSIIICYKVTLITYSIQQLTFCTINHKQQKQLLLQNFFNSLMQYKITYLDGWIYKQIQKVQHKIQNGLCKIKMLDCWCVVLWRYTNVAIATVILLVYYYFGNHGDKTITATTLIYLLNILTAPLNGLSWNYAGLKNSLRAINQLKQQIKCRHSKQDTQISKNAQQCITQQLVIQHEQILNKINQLLGKQKADKLLSQQKLNPTPNSNLIQTTPSTLLKPFPFLLKTNHPTLSISYINQNLYLFPQILTNITLYNQNNVDQKLGYCQFQKLCQLFQSRPIIKEGQRMAGDLSGGEKVRLQLVRAFVNAKVVVVDSQLHCLDLNMRNNIVRAIRYLTLHYDYIVIMPQTNVQQIQDYIPQLSQPINRCITPEVPKQSTQPILLPTPHVTFSTLLLYFTSPYHIIFLLSITLTTIIQNYYTYYMNNYVGDKDGIGGVDWEDVRFLVGFNLIYVAVLGARAWFFAKATVVESQRITKSINQNVVLNQMSFYEKLDNRHVQVDATQQLMQQKQLGQYLQIRHQQPTTQPCHSQLTFNLTKDLFTICHQLPFSLNILSNNIFTTLSSILIISYSLPLILILLIPLLLITKYLNNKYQYDSHLLMIKQKVVEEELFRRVGEIENGVGIGFLIGGLGRLRDRVGQQVERQVQIQYRENLLKINMNAKYKAIMMLLLIFVIAGFTYKLTKTQPTNDFIDHFNFINQIPFPKFLQNQNISGQFGLLISYTMLLSNFMLFFTVSLGQTLSKAISLQRIKGLISDENTIKSNQRQQDIKKVIRKIKDSLESNQIGANQDRLIVNNSGFLLQIKDLTFNYSNSSKQSSNPVINHLCLTIPYGLHIQISGKSGQGKTTLCKLLCSLYKPYLNLLSQPLPITFSPQSPLVIPHLSLRQHIDPWGLIKDLDDQISKIDDYGVRELGKTMQKIVIGMQRTELLIISGLRAYLYGRRGLVVYDQPVWIGDTQQDTYIVVTHHRQFGVNVKLQLKQGKLMRLK